MSWEYLLTVFIVCVSPGLGVVYTLSSTLGGGMRAGFWAAVGCTIATVFHLVVAMAGLPALVELGTGFSAMTFVVFLMYAGLAASGRNAILASDRAMLWLWRAFAASFAALGLKLAVARA